MKPPPVVYHGPDTVDEAVRLLAEHGGHAKVLAGGQSLVPMLNMRLTAPARLIDVNRLDELAYVRTDLEGVRVGALARHADVERATHAFEAVPLLRQAVQTVAHPTIRNRGTTVGSLVHADPCAEMPAVLLLLDGEVLLRSDRAGERVVKAADFFVGPMESACEEDELAIEAYFPKPRGRTGTDWRELSRRNGDYAMCGVGTSVRVDDTGAVTCAKAAYIGMGPVPSVVDVTGADFSAADFCAAAEHAADQLDPEGDIHASAEYRRHLARVLTARSLKAAYEAVAP
ncbi:FAD binding domain-containing protein [Catenulispora sp. NF23]|uniref:FAD binding domain-containing protein n=1 Tax=Catenulispora pinistramenti TaxID=2705254 RepID=UPI001BA7E564|nr:FAD binding domain-containing protein [Catenulispora pinistramenti]MBS2536467.1 FAD binding domain-containing protein [Catenulispora pinistramenti]